MEIKNKLSRAAIGFSRALLGICCLTLLPAMASGQGYQVSTGDDFGAIIDPNGKLFLWGAIQSSPGGMTEVLPSEGWESVSVSKTAASDAHILAIRNNGELWAWGKNDRGQVGNNTRNDQAEPVRIGNAANWVEVAAGKDFSLARRGNDDLYIWGDNTFGQLVDQPIRNDPNLDLRTAPQYPLANQKYIAIAAGNAHAHGIRDDGTLWAWGSGGAESGGGYELGLGSIQIGIVPPTQVGNSNDWTDLFGGFKATFATRGSGELYVWGTGVNTGTGSPIVASPARVGSASNWVSVSQSRNHAIALRSDGTLWGWGDTTAGALAVPFQAPFDTPQQLEAPDTFQAVGAGDRFSVVVDADGFMLSTGLNDAGQLANGSTTGQGQTFFDNSNFGFADIVATALVFTTETPTPGTTITGSLSLANQGTGTLDQDFKVAAVYGSSTSFSAGIPLKFSGDLSEITVSDAIPSGGVINVPVSLELPDVVAQGNYHIVLKADVGDNLFTGEIEETNELNNEVATEVSFEFFPDLVFDDADGIVLDPILASYDPDVSNLKMTLNVENAGTGTIPSDTSFDLRIFLSPTKDANDSSAVDLNSELTVTLASDLVPHATDSLAVDFEVVLPVGLATGSYYIGAILDVNNEVAEQTELLSDTSIVLRQDGEANNVFFTSNALVNVTGIPIEVAIDEVGRNFSTSGDADWFGQQNVFNVGGHSVQSPSIAVGETAIFGTTFTDPVVITFDWRSQTSSAQNKLTYRVVGGVAGNSMNEISGNTGWLSEQRVVPAGAQVEWVYSEGVDAVSDAVFVDNFEAFSVTKPDLVVDNINLTQNGNIIQSGTYVLNRDQLNVTINSRNQGTATGALDDFAVSIYLSADRELDRPDNDPGTLDDILLRQDTITDIVGAGNLPINAVSIDLPSNIPEGNYYLIAYVDDYTDANGDPLPGTSGNTGLVDEFTANGFPGEANNQFVTSDPIITIEALPDLVVTQINPQPGYYLVRELNPESNQLEPNILDFDFSIANQGLAAVNEPIRIKILLSRDEIMDPDSDYVVLDYEYTGGLAAAGSSASSKLIDPGAIDIRQDLVDLGYIGERLYFGAFIDSEAAVLELNETNNGINYIDNDFIFSELTVAEAFEFDEGAGNLVTQDTTPSFEGDLPWVGQTSVTVDGVDAAMSVGIGHGEVSAFETIIDAGASPTFVTFRWRVSSQDDEFGRDALNFYIDDFDNPVASIAGTEGGWVRVSRLVSPGEHTLRWEYAKDALISAGQDRGWVDDFSFQIPNLVVDDISIDDSLSYTAGDEIENWSVTIRNSGLADVPPTPSFDIQLRVSGDNTWDNGGESTLLTIKDDQGLAVDESRTYSQLTDGNLIIPTDISLGKRYYVGAYVDWSETSKANGSIPESNESDNDLFISAPTLDIAPSITLAEAIDDTHSLDLNIAGASGWFGVDDSQIPGGATDGIDAAQSGAIGAGESSHLETIVEGPLVLDFSWRVSSRKGSNFLEFSINGVVQDSISGEVDWSAQQYFIPAGTQELRWTYRKTGEAGSFEDSAWLDQVVFSQNPFDGPEIALTDLDYTAGPYVLDVGGIAGAPNQLVGTEYLDVTVEAENQGTDLSPGTRFTSADIEVRLSTDQTWGNGDDYILGTVNQVEGTLQSGDLMRFLGPIQLGDSIEAGFYYLMARVDANEIITEFDEDNNILISQNKDVEIVRLPALRISNPIEIDDSPSADPTFETMDGVNFYLDPKDDVTGDVAIDLDEDLLYYDEAPMRLRLDIQNIGLGRVEGTQIWTTELNLRGILRSDAISARTEINPVEAFIGSVDPSINLGSFTVQELIQGRSAAKRNGDIVELDIEFALPSGARLNDIIAEGTSYTDYLWFIEILLDSTDEIEESQIVNETVNTLLVAPTGLPWWIINIPEALALDAYPDNDLNATNSESADGLFGISGEINLSAGLWSSLYVGSNPFSSIGDLYAYAFNRNPNSGDTAGGRFPGSYGIVEYQGAEYLATTFDIVTRAQDLTYIVEAADVSTILPGVAGYELLAEIDGPFDQLVGPNSLTGDAGLLSEENVISVLDQGYSARVTVKDAQALNASRFINVRVEFGVLTNAWELVAGTLGITPPNDGLYDDFDGDGEINIVEWLTGATMDPVQNADGNVASDGEIFVASYFASLAILPPTANRGPFDDYDFDGYGNLLEIAFEADATNETSVPNLSDLERFVAEELLALGVVPGFDGVSSDVLAPSADFDSDGKSNIIELQNNTDPTDPGDTPATDAVDDLVAVYFAENGEFGKPAPVSIAPGDDFDGDGASNLAEVFFGYDPTDALDFPADVDALVESRINTVYEVPGGSENGDLDSDGDTDLEELALGSDPTEP